MAKLIKLEDIQRNTRKFYEICSDISISQMELNEMIVAIEKNSLDFENGKVSKDLFKYNDDRMKKESAKIIKKINDNIDIGTSLIDKISKEVDSQKIEAVEKKKDGIEEIKKTMKTKSKIKKIKSEEVTQVENPVVETAPEQKVEQGS